MTIREKLKSSFIFFDGAMGTELQKRGLKTGGRPYIGKHNRHTKRGANK